MQNVYIKIFNMLKLQIPRLLEDASYVRQLPAGWNRYQRKLFTDINHQLPVYRHDFLSDIFIYLTNIRK